MDGWPGVDEWLFAVKTFAAAMLAVYVALIIGLDWPYWAMATVYIVSQPLTGTLRSKALFRLLGTLIGATATVVLVPNLVDMPERLCAALALWTGLCLYISLLDHTPRSYVFMLAGYSAALIGFPSVTVPDQIWDIALDRVKEIGLGTICTTVVASVVLPRPLGPLLSTRILDWMSSASAWAEEALTGAVASARQTRSATSGARQRVASANGNKLPGCAKEDGVTCPAAIIRRYETGEQVRAYLVSRGFQRTLEGWRQLASFGSSCMNGGMSTVGHSVTSTGSSYTAELKGCHGRVTNHSRLVPVVAVALPSPTAGRGLGGKSFIHPVLSSYEQRSYLRDAGYEQCPGAAER